MGFKWQTSQIVHLRHGTFYLGGHVTTADEGKVERQLPGSQTSGHVGRIGEVEIIEVIKTESNY